MERRETRISWSRIASVVWCRAVAAPVLVAFCVASTFGSHIKIDFYWWYMGAIGAVSLMGRRIVAAESERRLEAARLAAIAAREQRQSERKDGVRPAPSPAGAR